MIPVPIIVVVPYGDFRFSTYTKWIIENVDREAVTYFWPVPEFSFIDYEDALMFSLKFGGVIKSYEKNNN